MCRSRAVVIVLEITGSTVDDLHWRADRARDDRGFGGVVGEQPPSEATADPGRLDVHPLGRDAKRGGHHGPATRWHLQRTGDEALAVAEMRGAVMRFERCVRDEPELERGV